jgi:hypothetical protein
MNLLGLFAGALFMFFGLWTLRGDTLSAEEASRAEKATAPAFFVVTSAFVLAELGVKTMLATITLAADRDWLGVWLGSTLGMVAADGLAILVGAIAGKHLPERFIQISAAAHFLLFGMYMVLENVFPAAPTILIGAIALAVVAVAGAISRAVPERYRPAVLRPAVSPGGADRPDGDEPTSDSEFGASSRPAQ